MTLALLIALGIPALIYAVLKYRTHHESPPMPDHHMEPGTDIPRQALTIVQRGDHKSTI